MVHLSTCTNGTSPSDRMHEKKVGEFDFWRREIALFIEPPGSAIRKATHEQFFVA